jgi:outer membrane phospholipase A
MSTVNNVVNYNPPALSPEEEAVNRSIIYSFRPQRDNNPFIWAKLKEEGDRSNVSQELIDQTLRSYKMSDANKFKYYELARQELEIMRFISKQSRSEIIEFCFSFRKELFKQYMSQPEVYEIYYRKQPMIVLANTRDRKGYFNLVHCDYQQLIDVYHTAIFIVKMLHREEIEDLEADFSD